MFGKDKKENAGDGDEGKTFDKDAVFVCVEDCWQKSTLYRRGDRVVGRKCPSHFAALKGVAPEDLEDAER